MGLADGAEVDVFGTTTGTYVGGTEIVSSGGVVSQSNIYGN
jgi:hypothetical protein